MEEKIKFVIIGLAAILALSLIFNVATLVSKQSIARDRDRLMEENASLGKKIESALQENQQLQKNATLLNEGVKKLTQEKADFQKKYELVDKARENLVTELQALKKKAAGQGETVLPDNLKGDAYWAAVLRQKKDLEWKLDNFNSELKNAQITIDQLQKEKGSLELELGNLNRDKQELSRQIEFGQKQVEYNKKMMDSIALELVGEKNDKLQIQDTLKTIKTENMVLRRQLKNLSDRKVNLERKLVDMQSKNNTLENRFNEMDIILRDKTLQIDKMNKKASVAGSGKEESIELSPILVRPQSEGQIPAVQGVVASSGVVEGNVLAINRENNFVVIDLGEANNVKVGDTFSVYRDSKPVARIEIIESRKSISACEIQKENQEIKIGDKVQ